MMISVLKKIWFGLVRSACFSQWEVGAPCQAVWSEDGLVYPAKVVAVDGDRCRVRFNGYGNEEDMELSSLKSPSVALQTEENRQVSTDVIQVLVEDTEKLDTLKGRDLKFRVRFKVFTVAETTGHFVS